MIARSDGASLGRGFSTRSRISYTVSATWRGDHAVLRQALPRDALDGEHGLVVALEHVEELPHARFPRRDDVVAQEHGERQLLDVFERYDEPRSEEHTSELQSRGHLVCRLLLEKKKKR